MRSILVVEDDAAMRELLAEELARRRLHGAGGAAARPPASRSRAAERFDLVVTDLRMPEMDGFDLIRGVMALPEPPHVVMITAFGSIETAIRAVKLGAYDYITKPFEIEELLLVADKALGERALRTQGRAAAARGRGASTGSATSSRRASRCATSSSLVQRIAGSTASRARSPARAAPARS